MTRPWSVRIFLFVMWGTCSIGYMVGVLALSNAAGDWGGVVSFTGGGVYTLACLMFKDVNE